MRSTVFFLRFLRLGFVITQCPLKSAGPMRLWSYFDTLELYNIRCGLGKFFFFFCVPFCVPAFFGTF